MTLAEAVVTPLGDTGLNTLTINGEDAGMVQQRYQGDWLCLNKWVPKTDDGSRKRTLESLVEHIDHWMQIGKDL